MLISNLNGYIERWDAAMTGAGQSANTIRAYLTSVRQACAWLSASGEKEFTLSGVRLYIGSILEGGGKANTAITRRRGLRSFATFLHEEGATETNLLDRLKKPKAAQNIVPKLNEQELDKLRAACRAAGGFFGCRDEAVVDLMAGTGGRANEVLMMELPHDVNLTEGAETVTYLHGKGSRQRQVGLPTVAAESMSRYIGMRYDRGRQDIGPLWISLRGTRLGYQGMAASLGRRAAAAGIEGFHPHRLRHTFAVSWLRNGGSAQGLMSAAGWMSEETMQIYIADARQELSIAESRRLFG